MKNKLILFLLCIHINVVQAWGTTGHRVVGEIASQHISNKTKRKIAKLLEGESLASVSTFADEIKSDPRYRNFYSWHYVNFDFGEKYDSRKRDPKGDIIFGIQECIKVIKDEKSSKENKAFYLKLLIHLVGDLHQPLHTGRTEDRGGNDINVNWFKDKSNLHKVWDEDMINYHNMSYTELASNLPRTDKKSIRSIQKGTILDWTYESQKLAQKIYASAETGDSLGYKYNYNHFSIVETQLQKGGIRLARLLDDIFK